MSISDKLDELKGRLGMSKTFTKARHLLTKVKRKNTGGYKAITIDLVDLVTDGDGQVITGALLDDPFMILDQTTGSEAELDTDELLELLDRPIFGAKDAEGVLTGLVDQDVTGGQRIRLQIRDHMTLGGL
jgi:hypothetical protein